MSDGVDNVDSDPESPRNIGKWVRNGCTAFGLVEWTTAAPAALNKYLATVTERISTEANRPEEAHTLKIEALFYDETRTALIYQCSQKPTDLREVLLHVPKPSVDDRRALGRIIATQVRSLYFHFQIHHTALRTESFVFFGDPNKLDLTKPYVLDWARQAAPDMYQHPAYQADEPLWPYQVWSLMMVLSEIAEWRPLDGAFQDEAGLRSRKLARKQLVTSPDWKGATTAEIFKYGFGLLEKDRKTLQQYSRWDVKCFYDKLCELLALP
ncbi:Uu.00g136450.m01.CDS01 [Anthostomella pinea]|uniref:Uu.00g136450.m01.CDS01 n=1 Tax=Anthostomella pinea TaxID=933095 RepID=A0AAI8VIW4_9PEZI|nr:Uu.00g136450.m01.CDS01 [Anthostomella pinea]